MHICHITIYIFIAYFFFFNDTATTEIYTLSLHDALPIYQDEPDPGERIQRAENRPENEDPERHPAVEGVVRDQPRDDGDRKSTRLNSSHSQISYAVFCLKKKKQIK